ncbi:MAG: hypothetical protein ACOH2M_21510 [Cypionkella sp.]
MPRLQKYKTSTRIAADTLAALRYAASELAAATGVVPLSDNERVAAFIAHWNRTKADCYAVRPGSAESVIFPEGSIIDSTLPGSPNRTPS